MVAEQSPLVGLEPQPASRLQGGAPRHRRDRGTTLEAGAAVVPEEEPADGDDERPEAKSRGHGPVAVDGGRGSRLDGLAGNDVGEPVGEDDTGDREGT